MEAPFRDLPSSVQTHVAKLAHEWGVSHPGQQPSDVYVVPIGSAETKQLFALFGFLATFAAVIGGISVDHWNPVIGAGVFAGLAGGLLLALVSARKAADLHRSTVKPSVIATPLLLAHVGLDREPIRMHYLRDLQDLKAVHHHDRGIYQGTAFDCAFKTGAMQFRINSKDQAEGLLAFLRASGDCFQRWASLGVLEDRVRAYDWIGAFERAGSGERPFEKAETTRRPVAQVWALALLALASMVIGVNAVRRETTLWNQAITAGDAWSYWEYLEYAPLQWHESEARQEWDDRAFAEAADEGKATPLREYLARFGEGRHAEEARLALRNLYRFAERSYLSMASKAQVDPEAAEGMIALLRYLGEQQSPRVTICFAPPQGIDGAAIDSYLKRETGSAKVHGVGPSFTEERNRARESRVVDAMQDAIRRVLNEDLFDLQRGDIEDEGPRFLVHYQVVGTGTFYTLDEQDDVPLEQRDVYAGIGLLFDVSTQVPGSAYPPNPDPTQGYRFRAEAWPDANFQVMHYGQFAGESSFGAAESVYDKMVDTAFQQFATQLALAYGLELSPR